MILHLLFLRDPPQTLTLTTDRSPSELIGKARREHISSNFCSFVPSLEKKYKDVKAQRL